MRHERSEATVDATASVRAYRTIESYWLGEIICGIESNLKNYFKSVCYYHYDVDKGSIQWDTIEPWEATYWRELPIGYRVRFYGLEKKNNNDSCEPRDTYWYHDRWYNWN
jgi:hypothetical protein